jgi:hypothetical protein
VIKLVLRRGIDRVKRSTAVVAAFGLAAPAAAQVWGQPAATVYSMTPERIAASTAAVVGLIAAVIGGLALVRPSVVSSTTGGAGPSWPSC